MYVPPDENKFTTRSVVTHKGISNTSISALFLVILVLFMSVHIETIIAREYAPETLLVKVDGSELESQDDRTQCFADIISNFGTQSKKPLHELKSIYEYIDSASFVVAEESGYFVLETGLNGYSKEFEIRVVCYAPDNVSVSYKIINNDSQTRCSVQKEGKAIIC